MKKIYFAVLVAGFLSGSLYAMDLKNPVKKNFFTFSSAIKDDDILRIKKIYEEQGVAGVNHRMLPFGNTLLHKVIMKNSLYLTEFFLDIGADPTLFNSQNRTALDLATEMGSYDIIKLLKDRIKKIKLNGPLILKTNIKVYSGFGPDEVMVYDDDTLPPINSAATPSV